MVEFTRPRVVGFNHVALEVGDIDEALAFYGRLFRFELRGKSDSMAFIDLGDQFIALQKGRRSPQTMVAISVSSSTTSRRPAKHSSPLVLLHSMVRSLIFGTPGATE
jgi:catechol 2,3-dioxygenase-like lactoylglutathione lyase family enzyme